MNSSIRPGDGLNGRLRVLSGPSGGDPEVRMSWEDAGNATRVLIVDDHDLFRTGLRALVAESGFDAAEAASGKAALRRVAELKPDVVVMDLNMPGMSGIEATRELLQILPEAAVLILTISDDDARVIEAVRAGARGYLLKDAPLEEILAGIRAAADGDAVIAPRMAGALLDHVRDARETPAGGGAASTPGKSRPGRAGGRALGGGRGQAPGPGRPVPQ